MDIKFDGFEELRAGLPDNFSDRRLSAAIATALTRTAVHVRGELQNELRRAIDRPTPYTVRQMRYVAANAQKLAAGVGFDIQAIQDINGRVVRYQDAGKGVTPAGTYMSTEADGGTRKQKRYEVALMGAGLLPRGWLTTPGDGAKLDAHGNVSRGQIQQILGQLRAQNLPGYTSTMSSVARKQSKGVKLSQQEKQQLNRAISSIKKAGGRFFVVLPDSPQAKAIKPGIYQREMSGRNITPVLIYVNSASYRPRFRFDQIAKTESAARLELELTKSIDEHIQKVILKGGGKK